MDTDTAPRSAATTPVLPRGWLDVRPLAERVERHPSGLPRGEGGERLRKAYYRAVTRGRVSVTHADELALELLGCHPAEVWGDAWLDA